MSSQVLSQRNNMAALTEMNANVYSYMESPSPPGSSSSPPGSSSSPPGSSSSAASTSSSTSSYLDRPYGNLGKTNMTISSPPQLDGNNMFPSREMNSSPNDSLFMFPKDSLITPYEHTFSDLDVRLRSPSFSPGGATDTRSSNFDVAAAALPVRATGAEFPDLSEKFTRAMGGFQQMSAMSWYEYLFMQSYLQFSANFGPSSPLLRNGNVNPQVPLHPNGSMWLPNRFDLLHNRDAVLASKRISEMCSGDQILDSGRNIFGMDGSFSPAEGSTEGSGSAKEDETNGLCFPDLENGEKVLGLEKDLFWPNRIFLGERNGAVETDSDLLNSIPSRTTKNGCHPPHHLPTQTANLLNLTGKRNSAFSSPLTLSARQRKKLMKESHRGRKTIHRGGAQSMRSVTVHHVLRWIGKEYQSGISQNHVNETTMASPLYTDQPDMETVSMETMTSPKVYNHRKVAGSKSPLGMSRKKFLMFLGLETVAIYMKDHAKQ